MNTQERLNRYLLIIDDEFASTVVLVVSRQNLDLELITMAKCQHIHDWSSWKVAILANLDSLSKCNIFGLIMLTPHNVPSWV